MFNTVISKEDWLHIAMRFNLSKRELSVVKHVFDDQCDRQIAAELGISSHTVNSYVNRIYRKLDVHSRVQLVVVVFSEHIRTLQISESTSM